MARWQCENKDPCQVTVGVDVTGIDDSTTVRNILTKERLKDKSVLKHIMRKCKIVNHADKETCEWSTDLIETKNLENYTRQIARDLERGRSQGHLDFESWMVRMASSRAGV